MSGVDGCAHYFYALVGKRALHYTRRMERSSLGDYVGIRTYYLARAVFRSAIGPYPALDTLSTWVLGATSGAMVFLFSTLGKENHLFRPGTRHWILWLLVFCIAMGLIQKFFAGRVDAAFKFDDQFITQLGEAINSLVLRAGHKANVKAETNLVDLQLSENEVKNIDEQLIKIREKVQSEYLESVLPSLKPLIKRHIEAYNQDPLHVLKIANKDYCWQLCALTTQLGLLFLILLVAVFFVS